jgi:ribosome-binding factor A
MDSNRLQKVSKQVQQDLAEIFRAVAKSEFNGTLVSVTHVRITADLGLAWVNFSVFPSEKAQEVLLWCREHKGKLKDLLVKKMKGSLRRMPDLEFRIDDALERESEIDRILKGGGESPIS